VPLRPGPTAGEDAPVAALVASGVARVVVGMLHPVAGTRGRGVAALRGAGVAVHVLSGAGGADAAGAGGGSAGTATGGGGTGAGTGAGTTTTSPLRAAAAAAATDVAGATDAMGAPMESSELVAAAVAACRRCNRALLYRCATGRPFSVFKYAMTLDGKIATTSGHAAWVTGPAVGLDTTTFHHVIVVRQNTVQSMTASMGSM
jgi:diaminohydroxyphosphoribosylaminopyrimidine deaminase/5-amino-6-(5-phosphoribosylamino)uracil reductase